MYFLKCERKIYFYVLMLFIFFSGCESGGVDEKEGNSCKESRIRYSQVSLLSEIKKNSLQALFELENFNPESIEVVQKSCWCINLEKKNGKAYIKMVFPNGEGSGNHWIQFRDGKKKYQMDWNFQILNDVSSVQKSVVIEVKAKDIESKKIVTTPIDVIVRKKNTSSQKSELKTVSTQNFVSVERTGKVEIADEYGLKEEKRKLLLKLDASKLNRKTDSFRFVIELSQSDGSKSAIPGIVKVIDGISASTETLNFGPIPVGIEKTRTIRISGNRNKKVSISKIIARDSSTFSVKPAKRTPEKQHLILVKCKPVKMGNLTSEISVETKEGDILPIRLRAEGVSNKKGRE